MSPLRFFKCSAGGNDFIVLDALGQDRKALAWDPEWAARLCTRRLSLGADGCILLSDSAAASARFELWNSDGSAAAFSGNGARCAVRALWELGLAERGELSLDAEPGLVSATVKECEAGLGISVRMGAPKDIRLGLELPGAQPAPRGDAALLGVPCLAVEVPSLDALDLPSVAPPLRHASIFPEGTNVSFHEPPADDQSGEDAIRLRIWERGVEGETLSSGTGCGIVALSLALRRRAAGCLDPDQSFLLHPPSAIPTRVGMHFEGDELTAWSPEGEAALIASGELGPDALRGAP